MNAPAKKTIVSAKSAPKPTAPVKPEKWGLRLLRDKTSELLKAGGLPPSQTLGNALAIAASDRLDLERLGLASAPLPEAARRSVMAALEKAKYPGASWEKILEPLLLEVWRDKKKPAPLPAAGARKPQADKARPPAKSAAKKPSVKAALKAPVVAPVVVKRAGKVFTRPT